MRSKQSGLWGHLCLACMLLLAAGVPTMIFAEEPAHKPDARALILLILKNANEVTLVDELASEPPLFTVYDLMADQLITPDFDASSATLAKVTAECADVTDTKPPADMNARSFACTLFFNSAYYDVSGEAFEGPLAESLLSISLVMDRIVLCPNGNVTDPKTPSCNPAEGPLRYEDVLHTPELSIFSAG